MLTPQMLQEFVSCDFENLEEFTKRHFDLEKAAQNMNTTAYRHAVRLRQGDLVKEFPVFDLNVKVELRSFRMFLTEQSEGEGAPRWEVPVSFELLASLYQIPVDQVVDILIKGLVLEEGGQPRMNLTPERLTELHIHQELRMDGWAESHSASIEGPGGRKLDLLIDFPKILFTAKELPGPVQEHYLSRNSIADLIAKNYKNFHELIELFDLEKFQGQLPVPAGSDSDNYRAAFELLKEQRYEPAAMAFQQFLVTFPDSELADNAQYWLAESHNGKGIMTMAVRTLVDIGFVEYHLQRIEIRCATGNLRSRKIADRLGGTIQTPSERTSLMYGQTPVKIQRRIAISFPPLL